MEININSNKINKHLEYLNENLVKIFPVFNKQKDFTFNFYGLFD